MTQKEFGALLFASMGELEEDLLLDCAPTPETEDGPVLSASHASLTSAKQGRRGRLWVRYGALAACAVLAILVLRTQPWRQLNGESIYGAGAPQKAEDAITDGAVHEEDREIGKEYAAKEPLNGEAPTVDSATFDADGSPGVLTPSRPAETMVAEEPTGDAPMAPEDGDPSEDTDRRPDQTGAATPAYDQGAARALSRLLSGDYETDIPASRMPDPLTAAHVLAWETVQEEDGTLLGYRFTVRIDGGEGTCLVRGD